MKQQQVRAIACGLLHDGINADKMTAKARAEVRAALETLLELAKASAPVKKGSVA